MKHTLVALMEDKPGVLNRVVNMFSRRAFNIESLTVGHTELPHISRMTVVVDGSSTDVEQVVKQLYKVIDVLKVSDVTDDKTVLRELALMKVSATRDTRSEILQIAGILGAKVVDLAQSSVVVEMSGEVDEVDQLVALMRPFGIKEMLRTGRVAMVRGAVGVTRAPSADELVAQSTQARRAAQHAEPARQKVPVDLTGEAG